MALVKRNSKYDLAIKNQENARVVGKNALPARKVPAATKRAVLGEIGNEISQGRGVVAGKKETKPFLIKKDKEEPVVTKSKNVTVRPRPPLRKAQSSNSLVTHEQPLRKAQSSNNLVALVPLEDIDRDDKEDPFLVVDYVNDIYDYLRELEKKFAIKERYLEGQEVTGKMRALLVDWLVDVHLQFHLLLETLYLTVAIIDRYLQEVRNVSRKKLQLVGVGAMFVASKYEEMFSPVVADFVYICDNAYNKEQILEMEQHIVLTLNFSFCRPLPLHFLRRYSKAAHAMAKNHQMAKYLMELSLVDYELCHCPPSLVSAAAMYLGLWVFSQGDVWSQTLEYYTTYEYKDIEPLVKKIANLIVKTETSKFKAIKKKYAMSKFLKVSCMPELRSDALRKLAGAS